MRLAQKARKIIGVTSTFVGVAMMIFGIHRGEMAVVLAGERWFLFRTIFIGF